MRALRDQPRLDLLRPHLMCQLLDLFPWHKDESSWLLDSTPWYDDDLEDGAHDVTPFTMMTNAPWLLDLLHGTQTHTSIAAGLLKP